MWLQFLIALVPTLGVAIPLISYKLNSLKLKAKLATEREGLPALAEAKTAAIGATAKDRPRDRSKDQSFSFNAMTSSLNQRALENSDHNIYGYINSLLLQLQELESKLLNNEVDQQARLTYAKYEPMVRKIVDLTSPKYYGDFVRNPEHWNDPKRMRLQVELSVLAVAKEAAEDIRRINSSQELDFQVSVESLIGKGTESRNEKTPEDALHDLLEADEPIAAGVAGNLEALSHTVSAEASLLISKEMAKKAEVQAKLEAEREAKKFRAGPKNSLEDETLRSEMLISRTFFQQKLSVFSPGGRNAEFLVEHSNLITGGRTWKKFGTAYEAADWVDSVVSKEEKKHSFKCGCVYCREE